MGKAQGPRKAVLGVLCFFMITGKAARTSCGARFLFNVFAVLDDFPYGFAVSGRPKCPIPRVIPQKEMSVSKTAMKKLVFILA